MWMLALSALAESKQMAQEGVCGKVFDFTAAALLLLLLRLALAPGPASEVINPDPSQRGGLGQTGEEARGPEGHVRRDAEDAKNMLKGLVKPFLHIFVLTSLGSDLTGMRVHHNLMKQKRARSPAAVMAEEWRT